METFRKKRNRSGGSPTIRVDAKGRFDLSKGLMQLTGFVDSTAVMFGFSKSDGCAYVWAEEPEDDSYYLRNNSDYRPGLRFNSINLREMFNAFFKIDKKKTLTLILGKKDEKDRHPIRVYEKESNL